MQYAGGKAVDFHEAWHHVMSKACVRAWFFDNEPPTAIQESTIQLCKNPTRALTPPPTKTRSRGKMKAKYECPICGIIITSKKCNLTRHIMNSHTNVRRFGCREEGCELRFKTSTHLKRHLCTVHAKIVDNQQYQYEPVVCFT